MEKTNPIVEVPSYDSDSEEEPVEPAPIESDSSEGEGETEMAKLTETSDSDSSSSNESASESEADLYRGIVERLSGIIFHLHTARLSLIDRRCHTILCCYC